MAVDTHLSNPLLDRSILSFVTAFFHYSAGSSVTRHLHSTSDCYYYYYYL